MRVLAPMLLVGVLLIGMALTDAAPVSAQQTEVPGVTIWRGTPADRTDRHHGQELSDWLADWRGRITAEGVEPIPKAMQKRFRQAFPAGLFDWARFRLWEDGRIWRQAARYGYGNGLVLVLDDVILFRTADSAGSHTAWYDGLAQAQEFRRFGPEKVLARRTPPKTRYLGAPNQARPYYVYPYTAPGQGPIVPPPDGSAGIKVPGKIIVKPVNPFQND